MIVCLQFVTLYDYFCPKSRIQNVKICKPKCDISHKKGTLQKKVKEWKNHFLFSEKKIY